MRPPEKRGHDEHSQPAIDHSCAQQRVFGETAATLARLFSHNDVAGDRERAVTKPAIATRSIVHDMNAARDVMAAAIALAVLAFTHHESLAMGSESGSYSLERLQQSAPSDTVIVSRKPS